MKEEALKLLKGTRDSHLKQIKRCETKMKKYPPNVMGYKDAFDLKQELERRVEILNYVIKTLEESK